MTQETKDTTNPVPAASPQASSSRPRRSKAMIEAEARACALIHAQTARARDAAAKAAREKASLERLVAESVSSDPLSVSWYDKPGVLSRDLAITVGPARNADGLHALMSRYRERTTRAKRGRG